AAGRLHHLLRHQVGAHPGHGQPRRGARRSAVRQVRRAGLRMDGRVILAVDEGTTGTRAALVSETGEVSGLAYRRLGVNSPRPGVVEQDADQIWERTLDACRAAVAAGGGSAPAAVAVTTQRATSVLWDARTGRSLVPAMVWQ